MRRAVLSGMTSVYFESPHRLIDALEDLEGISPESIVCVARELTKIHEEFRQGSPRELAAHYRGKPPRGEVTLLIDPVRSKSREVDYSEKTPIPRNFA